MNARARILVIDDNPDIREVVRLCLEDAGYEVVEAPDGIAGLQLFDGYPTDLVITDLIMPGLGGLATIIELRRKAPAAKIIAISGGEVDVSQGEVLSKAEALGVMRTLSKPFHLPQMLAVVEDVLGC